MTGKGETITIRLEDAIDLRGIAGSGQCFRWRETGSGAYRIPYREYCVTAWQEDAKTLVLDCSREEYEKVWRTYFDIDTDYRAIRDRIDPVKDPFLSEAMAHEGSLRILRQDPFEMLITSVITQNRNIPAITRSVEKLSELAGETGTASDGTLFFRFPTPEAILSMSRKDLDACRLGYRDRYVLCAAQTVTEGKLDLQALPREDVQSVMRKLLSVCGIGEKVACCVRLFGLHDLDAFPVDVWMKRVIETEYAGQYPMAAYAPYNGIYQQYMFAYYRKRETAKKGGKDE